MERPIPSIVVPEFSPSDAARRLCGLPRVCVAVTFLDIRARIAGACERRSLSGAMRRVGCIKVAASPEKFYLRSREREARFNPRGGKSPRRILEAALTISALAAPGLPPKSLPNQQR